MVWQNSYYWWNCDGYRVNTIEDKGFNESETSNIKAFAVLKQMTQRKVILKKLIREHLTSSKEENEDSEVEVTTKLILKSIIKILCLVRQLATWVSKISPLVEQSIGFSQLKTELAVYNEMRKELEQFHKLIKTII